MKPFRRRLRSSRGVLESFSLAFQKYSLSVPVFKSILDVVRMRISSSLRVPVWVRLPHRSLLEVLQKCTVSAPRVLWECSRGTISMSHMYCESVSEVFWKCPSPSVQVCPRSSQKYSRSVYTRIVQVASQLCSRSVPKATQYVLQKHSDRVSKVSQN